MDYIYKYTQYGCLCLDVNGLLICFDVMFQLHIYKCEVVVASIDVSQGWFYYACVICNRSMSRAGVVFSCMDHEVQEPRLM